MKVQAYRHQIHEDELVAELSLALNLSKNSQQTKRILCAFFQTIRVRIMPIASSAILAHLSKELKRLYMEGWNHRYSPQFDYDEFIDALYNTRGMEQYRLFRSKEHVEVTISAVFDLLKKHLTENQYAAMMSLMPLLLRVNLMNNYVLEGNSYFLN